MKLLIRKLQVVVCCLLSQTRAGEEKSIRKENHRSRAWLLHSNRTLHKRQMGPGCDGGFQETRQSSIRQARPALQQDTGVPSVQDCILLARRSNPVSARSPILIPQPSSQQCRHARPATGPHREGGQAVRLTPCYITYSLFPLHIICHHHHYYVSCTIVTCPHVASSHWNKK